MRIMDLKTGSSSFGKTVFQFVLILIVARCLR